MKYLVLTSILTFLTACSTYSPVQYVGGKQGSFQIKPSCEYIILGFNLNSEDGRLDYILRQAKVDPKYIYSIERERNWFLTPFHNHNCTHVILNDQFNNPGNNPLIQAWTPPQVDSTPIMTVSRPTPPSKPLTSQQKEIQNECSHLRGVKKTSCINKILAK